MRALAAFPKEKQLRVIDAPAPTLERPTQVRLKVLEVGVCGTDKEIASFGYGFPPDGTDHLIMGHESLMEVVEAGPQAGGIKPGQLAVLTVRRPCPDPACKACRADRQDFCETGGFKERGINRLHGYMAETVVEDAKYVVPLAPGLRDIGVLTEPTTIAEKGLEELDRIQSRLPWHAGHKPTAVVLGAGPVGLLGAALLALKGARTVVYSAEDPAGPNAKAAVALGCEYVSAKACPLEELPKRLPPVDVVYEATGASQFAFDALELLGPNGVFIFTGVPGRKGAIDIPGGDIMRRLVLYNQLAYGTVNAPRSAFEAAAADLETLRKARPGAVEALISARHPLEGFAAPLGGRLPGIKHVLKVAA